MLTKNIRRIAALTLALLLLLCAGCGSSAEPAADTPAPTGTTPAPAGSSPAPAGSSPAPTQTPATPESSADPVVVQAPKPETATSATPSDVNAPVVNKPSLEKPIERVAPESLQLLALGGSFTLTNAEGKTLTRGGSGVSGTMTYAQQQLPDAGSNIFSVLVPYSTRFGLEASNVSDSWGFEFLATTCSWCHCVAKGSGKLTGLDYDTGSRLTVRTEPGATLELTMPMPDSVLGEDGWVCLHLTAGDSTVSLASDGSSLSFSGIKPDAKAALSLDYGGFASATGLDVGFTGSSGTVDFSNIANGTISVS